MRPYIWYSSQNPDHHAENDETESETENSQEAEEEGTYYENDALATPPQLPPLSWEQLLSRPWSTA
jgi:hypothetical protein